MKRLTADVFEGRIVFSGGKLAVGCEDAGCTAPATGACAQALVGKRVNETCCRRFCERHGILVGGVMRCGAHARLAMKRGEW